MVQAGGGTGHPGLVRVLGAVHGPIVEGPFGHRGVGRLARLRHHHGRRHVGGALGGLAQEGRVVGLVLGRQAGLRGLHQVRLEDRENGSEN